MMVNPLVEVNRVRYINQVVPVTSRPSSWPGARGPEPVVWTWRGGRYRVKQIVDCWEEAGRWWEFQDSTTTPMEAPATTWRVMLQSGGIVELAMLHTQPAPIWIWYKSYD